jgi:hypothetical protein
MEDTYIHIYDAQGQRPKNINQIEKILEKSESTRESFEHIK